MKKGLLIALLLLPSFARADYSIDLGGDGAYADSVGYSSTITQWIAQDFTTLGEGDLVSIQVKMQQIGAPSDDVYIEVQSDNAGEPSGTVLGTSDSFVPAGSFDVISFPSPVALSASTLYWFVVKRSGANNTMNYYDIRSGAGLGSRCSAYYTASWNTCYGADPVYSSIAITEAGGGGGSTGGTWIMPSFASILGSTTEAANLALADFLTPFYIIFGLLMGGMFALLVRKWIWKNGSRIWEH